MTTFIGHSTEKMTSPEPINIQIVQRRSGPVSAPTNLAIRTGGFNQLSYAFTFNPLNRPPSDVKLPPGWTFHSLTAPANPALTPHSSHFLTSTSSMDATDWLPASGYFYHAERRITTNVDMLHLEDTLLSLLEDSRTQNTDEFTEMVAIPYDGLGGERERERGYALYCADHFNRTFTRSWLELGPSFGDSEDPKWAEEYSKWIHMIGKNLDSHISKIDVQNAFSMTECTSLLSALQKRPKQFKQPPLHPTFSAGYAEGTGGPIVMLAVLVTFLIWGGPMLGIPSAYFRRMRTIASRADKGEYLPHLWSTLIKGLLKEWNDLNIILALVLSANVGFLALPGISEDNPSIIADLSRGAGIFSMFDRWMHANTF
ncbi:hypothetical protein RhiTH_004526 [Rhizoctonia solani]